MQRHLDDLTHRLSGRANILLLSTSRLSVPAFVGHPVLELASTELPDLLSWLRAVVVTRGHVHHLTGIDLDVRELIRDLDVAFDVTIHDYFVICPQINLLRSSDGFYCGEPDPADCNGCIASCPVYGAHDILSWRRGLSWLMQDAERIICPSRDVRDRLAGYGLAQNAIVVPHEPAEAAPWRVRAQMRKNTPLRVEFLGR